MVIKSYSLNVSGKLSDIKDYKTIDLRKFITTQGKV
jgi:hypothetical protein